MRHIVVDTLGLLVVVLVTAASAGGPRRRCPGAGRGEDGDALPSRWSSPTAATLDGWSPSPAGCCASSCRSCANPKGNAARGSHPVDMWPWLVNAQSMSGGRSTSHQCCWPNKTREQRGRPYFCRNMVDDDSGRWFCKQCNPPHSRWWNELFISWFRGPAPGSQAAAQREQKRQKRLASRLPEQDRAAGWRTVQIPSDRPVVSVVLEPRPDVSRERLPPDRVAIAIRVAREVTNNPDWRERALHRASSALGEKLYKQSQSKVPGLCKQLNEVALELEKGGQEAERIVKYASTPLIERLIPNRFLGQLIAKKFASYITKPLHLKIAATAQSLRAYGVLICVVWGDLTTCPCLLGLIKPEIVQNLQKEVREVVERGLERLEIPL